MVLRHTHDVVVHLVTQKPRPRFEAKGCHVLKQNFPCVSNTAYPCPCGEGELVSGVHTLVAGFVQVYHRLRVLEEEEKGWKVEQEVEREDQGEETARMTMHMEMT